MTDDEFLSYYADLLILQYRGKSKARDTVKALAKMYIMEQLALDLQNAFNIDTAIGVQLDVLGKYAGVSRKSRNFTGLITLDDSDYRQLIKMKLIQNNSGSSLSEIQDLIHTYFGDTLIVFDFSNMIMGYFFDSSAGSSNLAEVFVRDGLLPKPMGVQLESLIYTTNIKNIFGMVSYETPATGVKGFNTYESYDTNRPWLKYEDAIVF